jgi:Phosphotransferase enzyme family
MVPGIDTPLNSIFVLCKDTIVKRLPNFHPLLPEVNALEFVRSHTSIPVSKVRQYITDKNRVEGYLMMEKIEGTPLNRLWDNLLGDTRCCIVSTLRDYTCQLREASGAYNCPSPGPIAENKPQACVGPWMLFGDIPTSPFPTCKDLMQFINKNSHQPLNVSQPLVLTHMDLTMCNIVVGPDWKVWLVDWEWSGFYPPWFEYIAMISATVNDNGPASWQECIPEVAGDWSKEKIMLGFWRF